MLRSQAASMSLLPCRASPIYTAGRTLSNLSKLVYFYLIMSSLIRNPRALRQGLALSARVAILAVLWGCAKSPTSSTDQSASIAVRGAAKSLVTDRADLSWVQSWGCWLQAADIQTLLDSPYDLVVIDATYDGRLETSFTRDEIQRLRDAGKIVLAYLSIGEAGSYRSYWQSFWHPGSPWFLGPENPDWPGDYKVRYWSERWWKVGIEPDLERIVEAGFHGVYLDIVDAYWYWGEQGYSVRGRANLMARLVERVATRGRAQYGDHFVVVPQNGLGILDDMSPDLKPGYLDVIDGVGVESLFYDIWSREDQAYRLDLLQQVRDANKLILNIEYVGPSQYDEYFGQWVSHPLRLVGYPAAPDHALDELVIPYPD